MNRTWNACMILATAAMCGCNGNPPPSDVQQNDAAGDTGPVFNNCTTFMDLSSNTMPTISFPATVQTYTPNCVLIHAGQSVTFSGAFGTHPLFPGSDPGHLSAGSAGNPIPMGGVSSGTSMTFTYATPGDYPYFCAVHYMSGMVGSVRVQ